MRRGLGIMGSSLYQAVAIGQSTWPVLAYFAVEFTDARVQRIPWRRDSSIGLIREGEADRSGRNCKYRDVVESRIVNLKQWPRYRLGNPSVMFRWIEPFDREKKKKMMKHFPRGAGGWDIIGLSNGYIAGVQHMTRDRVKLIVLLFKTRCKASMWLPDSFMRG